MFTKTNSIPSTLCGLFGLNFIRHGHQILQLFLLRVDLDAELLLAAQKKVRRHNGHREVDDDDAGREIGLGDNDLHLPCGTFLV